PGALGVCVLTILAAATIQILHVASNLALASCSLRRALSPIANLLRASGRLSCLSRRAARVSSRLLQAFLSLSHAFECAFVLRSRFVWIVSRISLRALHF